MPRREKLLKPIFTAALLSFTLCLFLIVSMTGALKTAGGAMNQPLQVVWQKAKLGKLSGDLLLTPNQQLLLPLGKKALALNLDGEIIWDWTGTAGRVTGNPVLTEKGIFFIPGAACFQELKPNGVAGWNFAVYTGGKAAKQSGLTGGAGEQLYLPTPEGLYAIDMTGRYAWRFSPWEVKDQSFTKTPKKQWACLASTVDAQGVYVVHGAKKEGFRLTALAHDGGYLGSYWLGDIIEAELLSGPEDWLYLTTQPKKVDDRNPSALRAFKGTFNRPVWSYTLHHDPLSRPTPAPNGYLYFTTEDELYALDAKTGAYKWANPLAKLATPPTIDPKSGRIYVGNNEGYLYTLNRDGRLEGWYKLDGLIQGAPLLDAEGYLYVATQKGTLYKLKDPGMSFQ